MRTEKILGYVGSVFYGGVVLVILMLSKCTVSAEEIELNPPDGVEIYTDIETSPTSGGDMDSGNSDNGGGNTNQDNSGTNNPSDNVLSNDNSNNGSANNNVHHNNNSWNNVWNNANNSNGQGNTNGNSDQGNTNGTPGSHGTKPCKGCPGSGYQFGNGDAQYLAKPSINNGDDGHAVVKVKIDKNGKVVHAYIKQRGTYGRIGDDSWNRIYQAAMKTKFKPDPSAGSQLRTGYLTYDLHPN